MATALYANGVRVFGRSLKYHRPRGLYSLDGECSNTCMAVDGIPNVRTENTPAKSGMTVAAQNVVGSADFDWMGFLDKADWLMPATHEQWLSRILYNLQAVFARSGRERDLYAMQELQDLLIARR